MGALLPLVPLAAAPEEPLLPAPEEPPVELAGFTRTTIRQMPSAIPVEDSPSTLGVDRSFVSAFFKRAPFWI